MDKKYSLKKARKILEASFDWYRKNGKNLAPEKLTHFEQTMEACDEAYLSNNVDRASELALQLEQFNTEHIKKTPIQYALEIIIALFLALAIAVVVRQMWFEPYEIPTGSMRPTFKEQDHLTVSKTQFGLNIPLETNHFYFDPALVQRNGIVIWSGDGIALPDTQSSYFGIIPFTKRYVKRLIAKPGDTLYFYGGMIYGVDSDGKLITELLDNPSLDKIDHIPFLTFEGIISTPARGTIQFEQMHKPIGRLISTRPGEYTAEIYNGTRWVKDEPAAQKAPHKHIKTYTDNWGMRNFAMARLLNRNELRQYENIDSSGVGEGTLYLELIHHPSLTYPKPEIHRQTGSLMWLSSLHSVIPLNDKQLDALMDTLYTARFVVKDGKAHRYSASETDSGPSGIALPGIPDGTYEFYYGIAYDIGWGGTAHELPKDHPLYKRDPEQVQTLFNMGIDMSNYYSPVAGNTFLFPHRYAYYRDGDLYVMGGLVLKKDDPTLDAFVKKELSKQQNSSDAKPYAAFVDLGAPMKDGKVDVDFIRMFGLTVPPKHYLVLGDNHAMSADSRLFGFLPEENIQGVPEVIIWPFGERWGKPNQPHYQTFTLPRVIVWVAMLAIGLGWYLWNEKKKKLPVFKKL